jgi:hypothetical protein
VLLGRLGHRGVLLRRLRLDPHRRAARQHLKHAVEQRGDVIGHGALAPSAMEGLAGDHLQPALQDLVAPLAERGDCRL